MKKLKREISVARVMDREGYRAIRFLRGFRNFRNPDDDARYCLIVREQGITANNGNCERVEDSFRVPVATLRSRKRQMYRGSIRSSDCTIVLVAKQKPGQEWSMTIWNGFLVRPSRERSFFRHRTRKRANKNPI